MTDIMNSAAPAVRSLPTMAESSPSLPDPVPSLMKEVPRPEDTTSCNNVASTNNNPNPQRTLRSRLPLDFEPTPYSVICGRGRKFAESTGNRRLAIIASRFTERYARASRKDEKTKIVSEIVSIVQDACPSPSFAFIRNFQGRWWEVAPLTVREKVGTVLRDCLHSKYRSSTKSKLARRKLQQQLAAGPSALMQNSIAMGGFGYRPQYWSAEEVFTMLYHGFGGGDDCCSFFSTGVVSGEELEMDSIFN